MTTTYHEPRTFSLWVGLALLTFPGVVVFKAVTEGWSGERNELLAAAVMLSLGGVLFWFATSRWGSEFKTITVDDRGLTVGPRALPPEAIGRTWVIGRDLAQRKTVRGRFQDGDTTFKVTYSTFGFLGTTDDVLVVEDTTADRPSVWFVASREPEAADAAVRSLRREPA